MTESGTRSVHHTHTHPHPDLYNCYNWLPLNPYFMSIDHVQFGEEEIPAGRRWNQSSGWSAD